MRRSYWEEYHENSDLSHEWFLEPRKCLEVLLPTVQTVCASQSSSTKDRDALRVLHIGCGTSTLGIELARSSLTMKSSLHVSNVDFSKNAIEAMRKARSQSPDAAATLNEWILADLLSLPFENCHFDLILDKGTFDAFEASDAGRRQDQAGQGPAERLCNEVDRVLKRRLDSAWLQITHSAPESRLEVLHASLPQVGPRALPQGWQISYRSLGEDETGFEYFVYFVRRRPMFELVRLEDGEVCQLGIFVDESQALAAASDAAGEDQQQVAVRPLSQSRL